MKMKKIVPTILFASSILFALNTYAKVMQAPPCTIGSAGQPNNGCTSNIDRTSGTNMEIKFVNFRLDNSDTYVKCDYDLSSSKLKVDSSSLSSHSDIFTDKSRIDTGNNGKIYGYLTKETTSLTGTLTVSIGKKGSSIIPGGGTFTIKNCQGYK